MSLLSDEDRKRLACEVEAEQYKASLTPASTRTQRIVKVVNSSFFLWFLSVVVVSSLSTALTYRSQSIAREAEREAKLQRALYEFGARWRKLYKMTNVFSPGGELHMRDREEDFFNLLFAPPTRWSTGPIFPEFKEHTLLGVAYEVEALHNDDRAKRTVRDLRNALLELESRFVRRTSDDRSRAERLYEATARFASDWRSALGQMRYQGDVVPWDDKPVPDFDRQQPK